MPELPEVMRVRAGLERLVGHRFEWISIVSGRYIRHGKPAKFDEFDGRLPLGVISVTNHGKLIHIELNEEWHLLSTLGMTGSWRFSRAKHSRIEIQTSIGPIFFDDPRNFGTVRFLQGRSELKRKLAGIGPSVDSIGLSKFSSRLRSKDRTVAEAMMDQSCVSGIGNYIKAEALFRARISPHRSVSGITDDEMKSLHSSVREIVRASFESGGASMRTFSDSAGQRGTFQERFAIYGRRSSKGGHEVVRETTADGRTTFWAPSVQS